MDEALAQLPHWIDLAALACLAAGWIGYQHLLALLGRYRHTLNDDMFDIRRNWMRVMLGRDNRITDAAMIGHVLSSASFFTSTTVLVIGGLMGALANAENVVHLVARLPFSPQPTGGIIQLKIVCILTIFIYGFFKFTWAIRQYNYLIALIGAAPLPPLDLDMTERLATIYARHFSRAAGDFNHGLRAYYFGLAGFAWFIDPVLVPFSVLLMLFVLVRRQIHSETLADITNARTELNRPRA